MNAIRRKADYNLANRNPKLHCGALGDSYQYS